MNVRAVPSIAGSVHPLVRTAHTVELAPDKAIAALCAGLGPGPFGLIVFFVSPSADFTALAAEIARRLPDIPVIGCTTAGEISPNGYTEDEIVAFALPSANFTAHISVVEDLTAIDRRQIATDLITARSAQARAYPDWESEFAFLMVDGLSLREDELAAALSAGLGPVPHFGGSAGDGVRFEQTMVLAEGQVRQNAAVVALIRSDCPIQTFKFDHLLPAARKMVVTSADPERRTVHEINAEPAAREYARLLGKDPEQLSPLIFAAHPVLVQIGGQHHVRSIQKVAANGDLIFFSAIDEGVVLTLAEPEDIAEHLERKLTTLSAGQQPAAILGCDCILRKIEAEQKQAVGEVSQILSRHGVIGFSTYGEQWNGAHVNQTLTGVAFYPPRSP